MTRTMLVGLPIVVAAGLAIPVLAQTVEDGGDGNRGSNQGQVTRKSDTEERRLGSLEEVIVTAQKRQERLQDVPISISVMKGTDLEAGGSRAVSDVLRQVPSVNITSQRAGQSTIAIRGIEASTGTSTVGYYQDDVPFAFIRNNTSPDANSYDLERVEVLRGPQGTLYGVNALNGVVRIITADANLDEAEFKARGRYSETEDGGTNYTGDAAVSVPLIPGILAVRTVAGYANYDGFISSTLDGGRKINGYEAANQRLKVNFQPVDEMSIKASYQRNRIDSDAPDQAADDFTTPDKSDRPERRNLDVYNLAARYEAEPIAIESTTGYIEYDTKTISSLPGIPNLDQTNNLSSFSEELRLTSGANGVWQWQIGGFYKETKEFFQQDVRPVLAGVLRYVSRSTSSAVFTDITRQLFDDHFEISGGVRYFEDEVVLNQQGALFLGTPLLSNKRTDYDKVTGRVVLTWKPSDTATVYGSYGTGFRSGIQQTPSALLLAPTLSDAAPDFVTNHELGTKGSLFKGRVTYESAVFYMNWEDVQQGLTILPEGGTTPIFAIVNSGDASGWGAEGAVTFQLTSAFSLNAAVGWNDLSFDQDIYQLAGRPSTPVLFLRKEDRLNESPEWTGAFGANFRVPVGDRIEVFANANYAHTSERLARFLQGTAVSTAASDKIDTLSASVGMDVGSLTLALFGDNLTSEEGAVNTQTLDSRGLGGLAFRLRPRTIGLQVSFKM